MMRFDKQACSSRESRQKPTNQQTITKPLIRVGRTGWRFPGANQKHWGSAVPIASPTLRAGHTPANGERQTSSVSGIATRTGLVCGESRKNLTEEQSLAPNGEAQGDNLRGPLRAKGSKYPGTLLESLLFARDKGWGSPISRGKGRSYAFK